MPAQTAHALMLRVAWHCPWCGEENPDAAGWECPEPDGEALVPDYWSEDAARNNAGYLERAKAEQHRRRHLYGTPCSCDVCSAVV